MCTICTGRVQDKYPDGLDITVKSSKALGRVLAPTWEIVMGLKEGRLTEQEYEQRYLNMLRHRYLRNPQAFLDILQLPSVTLQCYCGSFRFCHRHIAVDVLRKIAAKHGIIVVVGGERRGVNSPLPNDMQPLSRVGQASVIHKLTTEDPRQAIQTREGLWCMGTPNTKETPDVGVQLTEKGTDRFNTGDYIIVDRTPGYEVFEKRNGSGFDDVDARKAAQKALITDMPRTSDHATPALTEMRTVVKKDEFGNPMQRTSCFLENGEIVQRQEPYLVTVEMANGVVIPRDAIRPTHRRKLTPEQMKLIWGD